MTTPAEAALRYRVVPLRGIGGVYSINAHGDVAGTVADERGNSHPALFRYQSLVHIPSLSFGGRALALNDLGHAAGDSPVPLQPPYQGAVAHAYFWSERTGSIDLTPQSSGASFVYAMNNRNEIVGHQMRGDNSGPFIWRVRDDGTVEETRIGTPSSITNDASDINEAGVVAGHHFDYAWVYDSVTRALAVLPESERGGAAGLNDRDEVVGWTRHFGTLTAARWRKHDNEWVLSGLSALPDPNRMCTAYEINNQGVAIGECLGPIGVPPRGFVWIGRDLTPLDDVLVAEDLGRWVVRTAFDINDRGTILAGATFEDGTHHRVLLEPINSEPRRRTVRHH